MDGFNFKTFNRFADAYETFVKHILEEGNEVSNSVECTNTGFTVLDTTDLAVNSIRNPQMRYLLAELIWYWSGHNETEWISYFSSFWEKISDDGHTNNSAYGYIIKKKFGFDQLEDVVTEFIQSKDSRRCVIKINAPHTGIFGDGKHLYETKDEQCTIDVGFLIRDSKLDMTVHMRSNDMWKGLPYDAVFFCSLQHFLVKRLKNTYPELTTGSYTHFVNSAHIYDSDVDKIKKIIEEGQVNKNEIDIQKLIDDADNLYEMIKLSFVGDDGKKMSHKDYKSSKRFEDIISSYIVQGGV